MARPRLGSDVGGFGQVPLWVIQRAPGSAVRVFGWLSGRYADRDKIAPSRKTLAAELGITDPKVIGDALALLETIGALRRVERPGLCPELELCYSKPENRQGDPSEKTEGGSTKKRMPPFRKNGHHKDQESFQESVQERSPYVKASHQEKRPTHFWCGEIFCVTEDAHFKHTERVRAAGFDPHDLIWPDWYAERDEEWGTTDITKREPKGAMYWLAGKLSDEINTMRQEASPA